MKNLLFITILLSSFLLNGQNGDAENLLLTIQTQYEKYKSFESDFEIAIILPNEDPIIQKGKAYQKQDMFCLEMEEQHIISNGKSIWTYSKADNQANITSIDEGSAMNSLSPGKILKEVLTKENKFRLENTKSEGGKKRQLIEIVPTDRDEEYFKYHVIINPKTNHILSIKSFAKDGSRFLLTIDKFRPNVQIKDTFFVFEQKKYPGVKVEDLRL